MIVNFPRYSAGVARFEEKLDALIDSQEVGELTVAEAVGVLEIVKQRLIESLNGENG